MSDCAERVLARPAVGRTRRVGGGVRKVAAVEGRCLDSHINAEKDAMKQQMQVEMMKRECNMAAGCSP